MTRKAKPFSADEVALIRQLLKADKRVRDLALFNLAIDTMLRASDLLDIRVGDIQDQNGDIRNRIRLRQIKTGNEAVASLGKHTCKAVKDWIEASGKMRHEPLFSAIDRHGNISPHKLTTRAYQHIVKHWAQMARLDPADYSSHSLRRTKAAYIYARTGNPEAVRILLGHRSIASTSQYLDVTADAALDIADRFQI